MLSCDHDGDIFRSWMTRQFSKVGSFLVFLSTLKHLRSPHGMSFDSKPESANISKIHREKGAGF